MFEGTESEPRESEPEERPLPSPGVGRPVGEAGAPNEDPGRANAEATPKIGNEGQVKGQTSHPAPEEDVGA